MTQKSLLRRIVSAVCTKKMPPSQAAVDSTSDIDAADLAFVRSLDAFTMTSIERRFHLLNAVRYLVRNRIEGAIVECGVWRGGSMMLVARELIQLGVSDRALHLFDTFTGMPPPDDVDVDFSGRSAADRLDDDKVRCNESDVWAIASRADVEANMANTDYPAHLVHFVEGMVEQTVPDRAPDRIALLRLDTDWYSSTRHELVNLWPRLVRGGVLIIDDYGFWQGARKATDEFLSQLEDPLLLHRIDGTARAAVKL